MTADLLDLERQPPADVDAERAVLGSAMRHVDYYDEMVTLGLTSGDFYRADHAAVWTAISRLVDDGHPIDWVSVKDKMHTSETLAMLPSPLYLLDLSDAAIPASAPHHAKKVISYAAKRRAITAGTKILQAGWAPDVSGEEVQGIAELAISDIASPVDETTWSPLADIMDQVWDRYQQTSQRGAPDGIRWGYSDVDKVMAPLQPGDLAVVVAWSGGGKSVVAANLALDAAIKQGKRGLIHAIEMTRLEVGQRYAAKTGSIPLNLLLKGDLTPAQEDHLEWAAAQVRDAHLVIDEVETLTLSRLRASIRKHRPDLVVVDQIPIMIPDDARAPREQQVAALAYGLKRMASAERVAIVACAQLNSAPMQRADKRPTGQDIRESRAILQAANTVVLLHDPASIEKENPRVGEIDWIIEKQRQGAKDVVVLAQQFHFSRMACIA